MFPTNFNIDMDQLFPTRGSILVKNYAVDKVIFYSRIILIQYNVLLDYHILLYCIVS